MSKYNFEKIELQAKPFSVLVKTKTEMYRSHLDKSTVKKLERDALKGLCV